MVRTSFNTMALPHSRGRKGIFVSLTSSPHAFSRNPKLPVKPSWQSWMAGILLNQWLQPSHALCPPMDVSGSPHRACKVRFVSKCLHTSICSFQMLFSYIQLWGRKKNPYSSWYIISSVRDTDIWLCGFQPHRRSLLRKESPLKTET